MRLVTVLGNGMLHGNFIRHLNKTCKNSDSFMYNEHWQLGFNTVPSKSADLGVVFSEVPCAYQKNIEFFNKYSIPYCQVWPQFVKYRARTGTLSSNLELDRTVYIPPIPNWEKFIAKYLRDREDIYVV